jgi:hypothetical protein
MVVASGLLGLVLLANVASGFDELLKCCWQPQNGTIGENPIFHPASSLGGCRSGRLSRAGSLGTGICALRLVGRSLDFQNSVV